MVNDRPSSSDAPAIVVSNLTKRFGPVVAVDQIDFTVETGTITALLGGNGAGKTTTLAMLLGLVEPSGGTIEILGHDIATQRARIAQAINFESPYVDMPLRLTIKQNLTVYGRLYSVGNLAARISELAEKLELTALLDRPVGKLSSGQKTRAGLAKALLNHPKLMLLDEPTASLDPDTAHWVRAQLVDYCKESEASVLLASHNMMEVEQLCDHVLMMREGVIVDQGTPDDLIRRYGRRTMEEVFLDVARGTGKRHQAGDAGQVLRPKRGKQPTRTRRRGKSDFPSGSARP